MEMNINSDNVYLLYILKLCFEVERNKEEKCKNCNSYFHLFFKISLFLKSLKT